MAETSPPVLLVREASYLVEQTSQETVITGHDFAVPGEAGESWSTRNLTIRGHDVVLARSITAPGCRVTVHCRRVIVAGAVTIDVSGRPGAAPEPAVHGQAPGAAGWPGAHGVPGGAGGEIIIFAERINGGVLTCLARGGDGGRGQDGGNGVRGGDGKNGADAPFISDGWSYGVAGSAGKAGGAGGRGGDGGPAGSGGRIEIHTLLPLAPDQVVATASPGTPGGPGMNGIPGAGGKGGRGGRNRSCRSPEVVGHKDK